MLYRPVDEVQLALLSVERIESDVELTGRHKATARRPLHPAVTVDRRPKLAIREVVIDRLRADQPRTAVGMTSAQSNLT